MNDASRLRDEYARQLQETRKLLDELRRDERTIGQGGAGLTFEGQGMTLSAPGTEAFKQDFAKWEELRRQATQALEQAESIGRQKLQAKDANDRLASGVDDRPPAAYSSRSTATSRRWQGSKSRIVLGRRSHVSTRSASRPETSTEANDHLHALRRSLSLRGSSIVVATGIVGLAIAVVPPSTRAVVARAARERWRSCAPCRSPRCCCFWPGRRSSCRRRPHDLVVPVLVDVSRSMRVPDGAGRSPRESSEATDRLRRLTCCRC